MGDKMMSVKERNKQIKKVLAKEFGYRNVKVKGGKGTAYGWVDIIIEVPKPHPLTCEEWEKEKNKDKDIWVSTVMFGLCDECREVIDKTKDRVWEILRETGLINEIGTYYDDMGFERKECIIEVKLVDREHKIREKDEIRKNGYKIVYEDSWTWIYFDEKPSEEIRQRLKEQGFRFSRRRMAWYKTEKVEVRLN